MDAMAEMAVFWFETDTTSGANNENPRSTEHT